MAITPDRELVLSKLIDGTIPKITAAWGESCAEACAVCLENQKHQRGIELHIELRENGTSSYLFKIHDWKSVTEDTLACWNDLVYATEHGAYAIAILLIFELTEYTIIRRARKGTGVDFWLGDKNHDKERPFNNKARLEVSGLLGGDKTAINSRKNRKIEQTKQSDSGGLPAYVVIVEFSKPLALVLKK